jgi:hypothetical protein
MKPLDIHDQLIPILCLGSMLIGLLMPILLPEKEGIKKRSAVVFVFAVVVLSGYWLMQEDTAATLKKNSQWVLLGLGLIILKIISSRKRKTYSKPPPQSNVKPVSEPYPERIVEPINPVKKILILSANPKTTHRRRLDEEVREIEEGLRRSKYRDCFKIQTRWAVRLRDLRRALLDVEPQIVHFTGHGKENGLVVEDESGFGVHVPGKALSQLFELFSSKIECVILSACYSESQADAINKHIDFVIGMRKEINDRASIEFAVGFYDALGAGKSVQEAFEFGRNAVRLFNLPKHILPVLKKN